MRKQMPRQEFIRLTEENILMLDKMSYRLKHNIIASSRYSRPQLTALVRLNLGGPAKLKDIAVRELTTTANLCAMFRKLERDGVVKRTIDENDRRNTWYSVTPKGAEIAKTSMEQFRNAISDLFSGISKEDEVKLTGAIKTMNEILTKMEINNAQI